MNPLPFVIGAYAVILGGMTAYVALLWRRIAAARRALDETDGAAPPRDDG